MSVNNRFSPTKPFCTTVSVDRTLHKAIDEGCVDIVEELLDAGASVNCYIDGLTPMARAILHNKHKIAQKLLQYKPDVHQGQRTFSRELGERVAPWQTCYRTEGHDQHQPLLILAVQYGFPDIGESLLQQGADVNITDDLNHQTALHVAVDEEKSEEVKFLLKHDPNVNRVDVQSKAPLHLAVEKQACDIAETLIKAGATVNLPGNHDQLPLHIAAQLGADDLIKLLIDSGAMVNVKDMHRASPLHYAAQAGYMHSVRLLLDHRADCFDLDDLLEMPLHKAVDGGHHQVAEYLISRGCANPNQESGQGPMRKLPVQTAAARGDHKMLDILMSHGAELNARDSMYGETALHWATRKARSSTIRYLVEHGADVTLSSCPDGDTPLHLLCTCDNMDTSAHIAQMLIDYGANVNDMMPRWRHNREGALHIAVRRGLSNMTRTLLNIPDIKTELRDWNNDTALRIAIKSGNEALQNLLINHGCRLDCVIDNRNDVAYALYFDAYQTTATLVSHGAEVMSKTSENPLHILFCNKPATIIAQSPELMSLVHILLVGGAKVGRQSEEDSPLYKAMQSGDEKLTELLKAYSESEPSTLSTLSCSAIRSQLRIATRGRSIHKQLDQLPLPAVIREQLHLRNL